MQENLQLQRLENRVLPITSKNNFESMLLTQNEILLMSKKVTTPEAFWEAFDNKRALNIKASVKSDAVKYIIHIQGKKKVKLTYKKMLLMGFSGEIQFSDPRDLDAFLLYIEKRWYYRRTDKTLSPFKAILPYLSLLLGTVAATGYILYHHAYGDAMHNGWESYLLIKIGEQLGPVGSSILGLLIFLFVCNKMWKAYKMPPVETRLEP